MRVKKLCYLMLIIFIITLSLKIAVFGYEKIVLDFIPDNKGSYGIDLTGLDINDEFYLENGVKGRIVSMEVND